MALAWRDPDVGFSTGVSDIGFSSVSGVVSLQTRSDDGQLLTGDDADVIDEGRVFLFEERAMSWRWSA